MQNESSLVFSQGGSPQCMVDCFCGRVCHKVLLQHFLALYYKGVLGALLVKR